jgi:hypothetical protein
MTVSNLVNQKTWSTFGFAEQFAQGNERYIDPNATKITTVVSSGNPFLDGEAEMKIAEAATTTTQPFINWFTINADEMLAQFADEDEDDLILAPAIIEAAATPTTTKPRRPLTRRF